MAALSEGEIFNYSLCAGPITNYHSCHLGSKLFCSINWKGLINIIYIAFHFNPLLLLEYCTVLPLENFISILLTSIKAYFVQHSAPCNYMNMMNPIDTRYQEGYLHVLLA